MANLVGQQLGNYRLIRVIGSGAFAEVYLGEHIHLGTQAAIKVLHAELAEQDELKFREEARIIAGLVHPNIVRILDFGIEGKMPYLVMDYAPNGTLRDRHVRGTPVPLTIVISYIKQIADALQYAHDAKLIHRDVKPENLLIGSRNEILLGDFGIAVVAHSTRSQYVQDKVGTILYMSPEQINGYPLPASDQYSLGIIVYRWLTGVPPFEGTTQEILVKHLQAPPPPFHTMLPDLPPLVEQAVFIALQKDPKRRFATVQAFVSALEEASMQPPVPPGQFSAFVPTWRAGILICKYKQGFSYKQGFGSSWSISSMDWSPDGTRIAIGNGSSVNVWDATTGKNSISYTHADTITQATWSPNGKWLASASQDHTIQVREPSTGKTELTYTGHFGEILNIAWSPDSKLIASVSRDGTVHIWDILTGYAISTYQDASAVAWSPDRTRVALARGKEVQILEIVSKRLISTYTTALDAISTIAWSLNGTYISIKGVSLQRNEQKAANGQQRGTPLVQVWNTATGQMVTSCAAHQIAWSPDGKLVAIWGIPADWTKVQVWEVASGSNIYTYTGHRDIVNNVAWSPNRIRIVTCSNDGTVQVWGATDGGYVFTYRGHAGPVANALWSPDGTRIASLAHIRNDGSGPRGDNSIQVWVAG